MDPVLVAVDEGVARVTLNRPERLNALNLELLTRLEEVLAALDDDEAVRALVLTGAGRGFCSGADADLLGKASSGEAREFVAAIAASGRVARLLWGMRTPTVAAVNGPCVGGGASLAIACDLVLLADAAHVAFLFIQRGIAPDNGATYVLPRLVGLRAALELCLLGQPVDAEQAVGLGLATKAVPAAVLLDTAHGLAGQLAQGPPLALASTKRLLRQGLHQDHDTAIEAEFAAQRELFATADAAEGVRALVERRQPAFRGR